MSLIIMIVKIEAYHDGEFWCARGISEDIFTQGKTLDELIENIKEAVALHFDEMDPLLARNYDLIQQKL